MLLFIEFQKISSTKKWFSLTKISYQKQARKLQDAQAEKLTSLQANQLTSW